MRTYVVAVAAWSACLVAAPAMLDRAPTSGPGLFAAALTYRVAGLVCHQDPSRSFRAGRWPFPVCARCTGLYLGAVFGGVAGLVACRRRLATRQAARPAGFPLHAVRLALVLAGLPTALLWAAEWAGGAPVGNVARWLGALPLGAAVSWVVVAGLAGVLMTDDPTTSGVH